MNNGLFVDTVRGLKWSTISRISQQGLQYASTIILVGILSPDDFGLYSIALTIPNLIQIFRDWGTSYAIVNYSAKYNSENNQLKVKQIIFSGLILMHFQRLPGVLYEL